MTSATKPKSQKDYKFPPFNLGRLLRTVFDPQRGEKLCILIDLKHPKDVINFEFLKNDKLSVQKKLMIFFIKDYTMG